MEKIIYVLLLAVIYICPTEIHAFDPDTLPVNPMIENPKAMIIAGGAVAGVIASDSAYTYYKANGVPPIVTATGEIYQKAYYGKKVGASAVYNAVGELVTQQGGSLVAVAAYIGSKLSDISDYVGTTSGNLYTKLKQLIASKTSPYPSFPHDLQAGDKITVNGSSLILGAWNSLAHRTTPDPMWHPDSTFYQIGTTIYGLQGTILIKREFDEHYPGLTIYHKWHWYQSNCTYIQNNDNGVLPLPPKADYTELQSAIAANPEEYEEEIKDILGNISPEKVLISGATSAADVKTAPPPYLTPAMINTALAGQAAVIAANTAEQLSNISTANPSSVSAQIAAANAAIEIAKAEVESAKADAKEEDLKTEDVPDISEWGSLDFTPFLRVKGALMTHAPFAWVSTFSSRWDSLTSNPVAPSFNITLFSENPITCDLSIMDSFASAIRSIFAWLIYGLTAWACIQLYRKM